MGEKKETENEGKGGRENKECGKKDDLKEELPSPVGSSSEDQGAKVTTNCSLAKFMI